MAKMPTNRWNSGQEIFNWWVEIDNVVENDDFGLLSETNDFMGE